MSSHLITLILQSASFLLVTLCIQISAQLNNQFTQNGPSVSTYREILDPVINLSLQWTVNKNDSSIIFNFEADTRQIIVGLTNRGQINGSDVIVCGVDSFGVPYVYVSVHSLQFSFFAFFKIIIF